MHHCQCKYSFKNHVQRVVMITFPTEEMHPRSYKLGSIFSISLMVWMMEWRTCLLNLCMIPVWEGQHEWQRTKVLLTNWKIKPSGLKGCSPTSRIPLLGRKMHKPKMRVFSRQRSTEKSLGITADHN